MQFFLGFGLLLSLYLTACGGASTCDTDNGSESSGSCTSSRAADEEPQIGDDCTKDGVWVKSFDDRTSVALRCSDAVLGERSVDRLKCQRKGYSIKISLDDRYAYCVNEDQAYSFLYDADFGSYKPWHCADDSSAASVKAIDSNGRMLTLSCINRIYRPEPDSSTRGASSGTDGGMCRTSSDKEDVFAVMTLEDFDPKEDQTESFDPSAWCDAPSDSTSSPADNVSGSFLKNRH